MMVISDCCVTSFVVLTLNAVKFQTFFIGTIVLGQISDGTIVFREYLKKTMKPQCDRRHAAQESVLHLQPVYVQASKDMIKLDYLASIVVVLPEIYSGLLKNY